MTEEEKQVVGKLQVVLYGCLGLVGGDDSGKSDPYVNVFLNEEKTKSSVIKQKNNPFFNETFCFENVKPTDTLKFEVVDRDVFGKDDHIGNLEIPLDTLPEGVNFVDTFPLQNVKKGKIVLGFQLLGFGCFGKRVPNFRYMKIGGSKGMWRWEDMKKDQWSPGMEVKATVDSFGVLSGRNKMDFKFCKEWNKYSGSIKDEYLEYVAEVFVDKKTNHTNTNELSGFVKNGKFEGNGHCFWASEKNKSIEGKKCRFKGSLKYSPFPPRFWKRLEKENLMFSKTFNCF